MQEHAEFLKGKVALITGAAGDLGHALARQLLKYGLKLVITDRDSDALEEFGKELTAQGGEVSCISGNLEDIEFCRSLPHYAVDKFQSMDILINNAGIAHKSPIEDMTPELFDAMMKVNVRAPYFVSQEALPYLRVSDVATIINIGSVTAHRAYNNQSVFTVSKHALLGVTKAFARECYEDGIQVHIISPGAVQTDMINILRPDLKPEELILPEDIASLIGFYLERRKSSFVIDEVRIHRTGKAPF
ncbi:MAG: SDR family oxidoreductase [Eubacterium sp.]|nr:SDR family oxidoreductase [Eubacterium sp.]